MNACKGFGDPRIRGDTGLQKIHRTCTEEGAGAQEGEPDGVPGLEWSLKVQPAGEGCTACF